MSYTNGDGQVKYAGASVLEDLHAHPQPHIVVNKASVASAKPCVGLAVSVGVRCDGGFVVSSNQRKGESREDYLARRHADREAHKDYYRAYNESHAEQHRLVSRAYYKAHAEKVKVNQRVVYRVMPPAWWKARRAVDKAIHDGRLIPSAECSVCEQVSPSASDGRRTIQAHHCLGYEREHWLDVIWLCPRCHKRIDSEKAQDIAPVRGG